jgi:hypothetical protein
VNSYAYISSIRVYQNPTTKKHVVILGDYHGDFSKELNEQQKHFIIDKIIKKCEKNKLPLDFLYEHPDSYSLNLESRKEEKIEFGTVNNKKLIIQTAFNGPGKAHMKYLPIMGEDYSTWLTDNLHVEMSETDFKNVQLQSIDPRQPCVYWANISAFYSLRTANLPLLENMASIEDHICKEEFLHLIQNNPLLKEQVDEIERRLKLGWDHIHKKAKEYHQNFGATCSIDRWLDYWISKERENGSIFANTLDKIALLSIARSQNIHRDTVLAAGGLHACVLGDHLKKLGYQIEYEYHHPALSEWESYVCSSFYSSFQDTYLHSAVSKITETPSGETPDASLAKAASFICPKD